jgi:hypothetical protein
MVHIVFRAHGSGCGGIVSDEVSLVVDVSTVASSAMTGGGGTGVEFWMRTGGSIATGLGDGDI